MDTLNNSSKNSQKDNETKIRAFYQDLLKGIKSYHENLPELTETESIDVISEMIRVLVQLIFEYCNSINDEFDPEDYIQNIKYNRMNANSDIFKVFFKLKLRYNLDIDSHIFNEAVISYYESGNFNDYSVTINEVEKKSILKNYEEFESKCRIHYKFYPEFKLIMTFKDFIIGRLDDKDYVTNHPLN